MSKVLQLDGKNRELVFYSPNQLMSLDITKFSRFQNEAMEILMQYGQKIIKFGGEHRLHENGRKIYILKLMDIFDSVTPISDRVEIKSLIKDILDLVNVTVMTYDNNKLTNFAIFTQISHIESSSEIEFMLNDDLEISFANRNTIVQSTSSKKAFTSVDLLEVKNMEFSEFGRNLFKNMLKHFLFIKMNQEELEYGAIEYSIEEFRGITNIGIKYKRYSDLNKFILLKLKKEFKDRGLIINFTNKTFGKQTIKIIVSILVNDKFLSLADDIEKRAYAKDKKPKIK